MSHNERCKICKERIFQLLTKVYGTVNKNYRIYIGTKPEDYLDTPYYSMLSRIFQSLQKYRGNQDFIFINYVDVDFFIPSMGRVIEFDESQHFTIPRKVTLLNYDENFSVNFPISKWIDLCESHQSRDNSPVYRDEQRAWYDTIRDCLKDNNGDPATTRLYARDQIWCELDSENPDHIALFKRLIETPEKSSHFWLATVTLQSNCFKYPNDSEEENTQKNEDRFRALSKIVTRLSQNLNGTGIVLFPGGYFHSGKQVVDSKEASFLYTITERVTSLLKELGKSSSSDLVVCFGIDGKVILEKGDYYRLDTNQVAIAITQQGLVAFAKKFSPTDKKEKKVVDLAESYSSYEYACGKKYPRIFQLGGKSFYLAVCNDIEGLKRENPLEVDSILAFMHGNYLKKDDGPTGNYMVTKGFSGLSRNWKIPVFGAVVFINRLIAPKWRTGVYYRKFDKPLKNCETDENSLAPFGYPDTSIRLNEGHTQVDIYDIDGIFRGRPKYREFIPKKNEEITNKRSLTANSNQESKAVDMFAILRQGLEEILGNSIIEQKTKITFQGKNLLDYPSKSKLDMISIYRPSNSMKSKIRFRVYPYVLSSNLRLPFENILKILPSENKKLQERENPHDAEIFFEGYFYSERDIEMFIEGLRS